MKADVQAFLDDCRARGIEVTEHGVNPPLCPQPRIPGPPERLPRKQRPRGTVKPRDAQEKVFDALCLANGLPIPEREVEFAKKIGRKWRADYLFGEWLLVEIVGGIWQQGHHTRGQGQLDDMEKQNHAALLGYTVLEFTPEQVQSGAMFPFIKRVLEAQGEPS